MVEIIRDLNLAIRQGEKSSSRAKWLWESALFRMMSSGEEKPDAGTITCRTRDGVKTSHFVRQVGIISQHPFLFNDTAQLQSQFGTRVFRSKN